MPEPYTDTAKKQVPVTGRAGAVAAAIAAACTLCASVLTMPSEGLRTHPYMDMPGGRATVCYGETEQAMRVYTPGECGDLLRQRLLRDYAPKVLACVPGLYDPKRQPIFAALIDASYNAGWAAVCASPMAANARAGQWRAACDSFPGWFVTARNRKTGVRVKLPGLVTRRKTEADLCRKGL
jgi:lysozyme